MQIKSHLPFKMGINDNCVILQPRILYWPILKPDIEIKHNLNEKRNRPA